MRLFAIVLVFLPGPVVLAQEGRLGEEFFRAMDTWSEHQLTSYRYDIQPSYGGCTYPKLRVTVRESEVTDLRYVERGEDCQLEAKFSKGERATRELEKFQRTIAGLFAEMIQIQGWYNRLPTRTEYHPKYGFPVFFGVYTDFRNTSVYDYEYSVTGFRRLRDDI